MISFRQKGDFSKLTRFMEQAKNTLFNTGVIYSAYTEAGVVDATGTAKVYYSADDQMRTICFYL